MTMDEVASSIEGAQVVAFPAHLSKKPDAPLSPGDSGGAPPAEPPDEPPHDGEDGGDDDVIERMNREFAFVLVGSRAVVMREQPDAPIEDRTRILSLDAFKAYHQNQGSMVRQRKRQEDGSWREVASFRKHAPLWLSSKRRRTYDGVEFFPDPHGAAGTRGYYNFWRGFSLSPDNATPAAERWKKYKIYRDHLLTNVVAGDKTNFEWIFAWMAQAVQRPRERIGTAIVLRGRMGVGKTVFGDVLGSLFPSHYFLVDDPRYVLGQFNAHMASCLVLQIDEGVWAGDKAAEGRLKGLITAPKQMIEAKGVDPIRLDNFVRLIFTSNENWVVPAGMDERRFAVFDVAEYAKENHGYFAEMYAELDNGGRAALLADLLAYDLDAPGAPNLRVIPKTQALLEQKIRSLDPIPSWWLDRLVDGSQTHRGGAWRVKIPRQTVFNDYQRASERQGVRRRAAQTEFGIHLRRLVPGLKDVQSFEDVEEIGEDGRATITHKRVWCYLFPPHEDCRAAFEAALKQPFPWPEEARVDGVANDGVS